MMSRATALTVIKNNMTKYKVCMKIEMRHDYEIEAENGHQAALEAIALARKGDRQLWWEIEDVDLLSFEEIIS